jgi:ankyrin repeat protein
MPDDKNKNKPIPPELVDIAFPTLHVRKFTKTPDEVIASHTLEDIFAPRGDNGISVFQHAAINRPEIAGEMLKKDGVTADHVFMQDNNGNTALHYAANRGNEQLARDIIDFNGATSTHLKKKNIREHEAIDVLRDKGHEELAQYLQEKINKLKAVEIASQPAEQTYEPAKSGKPKLRLI